MRSIKLALYLLRIPRIFLSILLFPLLISLLFLFIQLFVSGLIIHSLNRSPETVQTNASEGNNFVRSIMFGRTGPAKTLQICRWNEGIDADGLWFEEPPHAGCAPDRLDAALQVANPALFDPSRYQALFEGEIDRLHICRACAPDIAIKIDSSETHTTLKSIWAVLIIDLAQRNDKVMAVFAEAHRNRDELSELLGKRSLLATGFQEPIGISGIQNSLIIAFNITLIIIVALWLAVKAHRRVLEYFARNGALLPLVAASGKSSFYGALWVVTLLRVGAFLTASAPVTFIVLSDFFSNTPSSEILRFNHQKLALWIITIVASLGLAAILASIADLKNRHSISSVFYKFLPVILSLTGATLWGVSFIFEGEFAAIFRAGLTGLPVIGIGPVLLAPIFQPHLVVLSFHIFLSLLFITFVLRSNTRWFAAHLEEI